jgi:hypothetical protein
MAPLHRRVYSLAAVARGLRSTATPRKVTKLAASELRGTRHKSPAISSLATMTRLVNVANAQKVQQNLEAFLPSLCSLATARPPRRAGNLTLQAAENDLPLRDLATLQLMRPSGHRVALCCHRSFFDKLYDWFWRRHRQYGRAERGQGCNSVSGFMISRGSLC